MDRNEILDDVNNNVYTNTTQRIKGNTVRDRLRNFANWFLNKISDKDVDGGFLGITDGRVDVSFIKQETPEGKMLSDDGTWQTPPSGTIPTLQEVTEAGFGTTNQIMVVNTGVHNTKILSDNIRHSVTSGDNIVLQFTPPTGNGKIIIPDVANSTETFALVSDIPAAATPTLQEVTDEGAETNHPLLVRQAGDTKNLFRKNGILHTSEATGNTSTWLSFSTPTGTGSIAIPDAGNAAETLAFLSDVPTVNDHFRGKYTSLANLQAAIPTGNDGDYAIVDAGVGVNAVQYLWDANEGWVVGSTAGASTTDALPEGSLNLYFTNARALSAAPAETASSVGTLINGASAATPADADRFGFSVSSVLKYVTWANIKAGLKSYFDTIYTNTSDVATQISTALTGYATQSWVNAQSFLTAVPLNQRSVLAETATDGIVSSSTSNTYSAGVLITPSMIDADTSIDVIVRVRKTGTANTLSIRIYANTTNDITGSPILLGAATGIGSTTLMAQIQRFLVIKVKAGTGAGTEVLNTAFSTSIDYGVSTTSAVTTCAIDWTSNKYIVVAVQTASGADAAKVSFLKVRR